MGGYQQSLSPTQPPQGAGFLYPGAPTHTVPTPINPIAVANPIQFKGPSLGGLSGLGTFHTNPTPIPQPSLPQPTNPGGLTVQHPIEMRPQRG